MLRCYPYLLAVEASRPLSTVCLSTRDVLRGVRSDPPRFFMCVLDRSFVLFLGIRLVPCTIVVFHRHPHHPSASLAAFGLKIVVIPGRAILGTYDCEREGSTWESYMSWLPVRDDFDGNP